MLQQINGLLPWKLKCSIDGQLKAHLDFISVDNNVYCSLLVAAARTCGTAPLSFSFCKGRSRLSMLKVIISRGARHFLSELLR